MLSTARPPRAIAQLHAELGLQDPIIAYNGALVYDPIKGQSLLAQAIPKAVGLGVVAELRALDPGINLGLELSDEWHVDAVNEHLRYLLETFTLTPPQLGDIAKAITASDRPISKIYFLAPEETRAAAAARFAKAGLLDQIAITSSGPLYVEILARDVSKGAALRALALLLGIPREQTMALGDQENDISALEAAGLGIAMGNAAPAVKAAAALVVGTNEADGWAEAIERHVLGAAV